MARWVARIGHASRTFAPEPAVIGRRAPTRTVSRRPVGGSRAATQTRWVPSRRYNCTLSPVISRRRGRTSEAASTSVSPAPADNSANPGPGRQLSVAVAHEETVDLEAHGETVRRGTGQAGPRAQLVEVARLFGNRMEDCHRFVQHSDPAMLSHRSIPPSRIMGSISHTENGGDDAIRGRTAPGIPRSSRTTRWRRWLERLWRKRCGTSTWSCAVKERDRRDSRT